MREKSACTALKRTPDSYGGAAPALDHLPITRRSARTNDHAAKTPLFEVPIILAFAKRERSGLDEGFFPMLTGWPRLVVFEPSIAQVVDVIEMVQNHFVVRDDNDRRILIDGYPAQ